MAMLKFKKSFLAVMFFTCMCVEIASAFSTSQNHHESDEHAFSSAPPRLRRRERKFSISRQPTNNFGYDFQNLKPKVGSRRFWQQKAAKRMNKQLSTGRRSEKFAMMNDDFKYVRNRKNKKSIEFSSKRNQPPVAEKINNNMFQPQVNNPCYEGEMNPKTKKAKFCMPEFVNAAFGLPVRASSTCDESNTSTLFCPKGRPYMKFGVSDDTRVHHNTNESNSEEGCSKCNASHSSPTLLTDLHNPNDETCWSSDAVEASKNITLTISLGKKYEITYISLHFCSETRPKHMAIFKSMNHGRTWQPFQFYSDDCLEAFGVKENVRITRVNEQEALCVATSETKSSKGGSGISSRIAFSTLAERPSAMQFDRSPVLQDWVTATDIKIVFPGEATLLDDENIFEYEEKDLAAENDEFFDTNGPKFEFIPKSLPLKAEKSETSTLATLAHPDMLSTASNDLIEDEYYEEEEDTEYYDDFNSNVTDDVTNEKHIETFEEKVVEKFEQRLRWIGVSDLSIGGRCKCNGHASECVLDEKSGKMACQCEHHTTGKECEKCKPFHFDRPWSRATPSSASECVACSCHSHARRCRFNSQLFQLSGGKSGGVCLKCRHNTAGRRCHYCREGYYRVPNRPMEHRRACTSCNCHPIGSSGKICNQNTGQCPCKEGVIGRECNKCAPGYQQSGSPVAPCIAMPSKRSRLALSAPQHPTSYNSKYGPSYSIADARNAAVAAEQRNPHKNPMWASPRMNRNAVMKEDVSRPLSDSACTYPKRRCVSSQRVKIKKYCELKYVYLIRLNKEKDVDSTSSAKEKQHGAYTVFDVSVDKRYKHEETPGETSNEGVDKLRRGDHTSLYVETKNLPCMCPKLKRGRSYLILSSVAEVRRSAVSNVPSHNFNGTFDFILDEGGEKTILIEWKREWRRRMKRFKKRAQKYCSSVSTRRRAAAAAQ